jgi:hypothetical protein
LTKKSGDLKLSIFPLTAPFNPNVLETKIRYEVPLGALIIFQIFDSEDGLWRVLLDR